MPTSKMGEPAKGGCEKKSPRKKHCMSTYSDQKKSKDSGGGRSQSGERGKGQGETTNLAKENSRAKSRAAWKAKSVTKGVMVQAKK